MKKEGIRIIGRLSYILTDAKTGKVFFRSRKTDNLVVNKGLDLIRDLIGGNLEQAPTHIEVGTNNTAPTNNDTTINTETSPRFREVITTRIQNASFPKINLQLFIPAADANGNILREAGIFNDDTIGDMLSRVLISPEIIKDSSTQVTLDWEFTIARG